MKQLSDAQREALTNAAGDETWHAACEALILLDEQAARIEKAITILAELDGCPTYDDRWGDTAKQALAALREGT